jgi:hypothetical protein
MKKLLVLSAAALLAVLLYIKTSESTWSQNNPGPDSGKTLLGKQGLYRYPDFYRGIYLTSDSARNTVKLTRFISRARESHLNALVLDVQDSRNTECVVPRENVDLCLKNGLHPIARIVVFPDGLKRYPVSEKDIQKKIDLAESACRNGFREIQFDYIRFDDYGSVRKLTLQEKYDFIEGFLGRARASLKKHDTRIAADIFGRIPLNSRDEIGQRIEGLDKVVDIICPMAYPSHYTWSAHLMADPYNTVLITSKKARERAKNAEVVTYIQAFKMKLAISKLPFDKYIEVQIKAVHDSGVRGFLMWNARQEYDIPFSVVKGFYDRNVDKLSALPVGRNGKAGQM